MYQKVLFAKPPLSPSALETLEREKGWRVGETMRAGSRSRLGNGGLPVCEGGERVPLCVSPPTPRGKKAGEGAWHRQDRVGTAGEPDGWKKAEGDRWCFVCGGGGGGDEEEDRVVTCSPGGRRLSLAGRMRADGDAVGTVRVDPQSNRTQRNESNISLETQQAEEDLGRTLPGNYGVAVEGEVEGEEKQ
eukprot:Cvel_5890.t1-p1 / transcript=Cvel_5890.t1 / gene=Cvel_5890 / organism=Chromera_velia_CCMP2878 / gene_product=hypothetical protein / transcript_product=hypothetical protein / location=Cvel_scaffold281:986-3543(-) / protein_length=188 / sequence_SO=supercontig / SO=protein_coding / is_pseudo=false